MAKLPSQNVLVLNRYYASIHVCGLIRAIGLTCEERAEIIFASEEGFYPFSWEDWVSAYEMPEAFGINPSNETIIKTGKYSFFTPKVIRLTASSYIPAESKRLSPSRANILARDDNTCQYCGVKYAKSNLNMDHIIPRSRGGGSSWKNLVTSCRRCNSRKADRTPAEAGMPLIREPFKPKPIEFLTTQLDPKIVQEYASILGVKRA